MSEEKNGRVTNAILRGDIQRIEEKLEMYFDKQEQFNDYVNKAFEKRDKRMAEQERRLSAAEITLAKGKGLYLALTVIVVVATAFNIVAKFVGG